MFLNITHFLKLTVSLRVLLSVNCFLPQQIKWIIMYVGGQTSAYIFDPNRLLFLVVYIILQCNDRCKRRVYTLGNHTLPELVSMSISTSLNTPRSIRLFFASNANSNSCQRKHQIDQQNNLFCKLQMLYKRKFFMCKCDTWWLTIL